MFLMNEVILNFFNTSKTSFAFLSFFLFTLIPVLPLGCSEVIVESDNEMMVRMLIDLHADQHSTGLVGNIQEICCWDWEVQFAKISGEADKVADFMAKMGLFKKELLIVLSIRFQAAGPCSKMMPRIR
ncbi:hypothetical protein J1N35_029975 [Gossypium stocksii]|uniref:RNase H type-1 domain-containing protein n=1 Tax=Gossypium stocksii TaxID=47602 RepID=A0A9D3ZTH1_9ROSI|nr:hypothetical protein J1N35_029975 [Gossypium stocksii]